jgi:meso-butanediol dehydrogenase/(S,S)-butanediol dehydrogenase/diacetyl reductase
LQRQRFVETAVVVTGAASGIGRATAEAFLAEGASLLAVDVDGPGLEKAMAEMSSLGGSVDGSVADLSKPDDCRRCIAEAVDRFGKLDVLCNIAGYSELAHFTHFTDEQWLRIVATNLGSVVATSQAAIPHLLESSGNIVNVGSVAGLVGNPYNALYCATKGGVVQLTRALAIEYSKRGIRVNCVCPGSVITPAMHRTVLPKDPDPDPELFGWMKPPLGDAMPEVVSSAILYLASPEAVYTTGVAFPVDGGRTAY